LTPLRPAAAARWAEDETERLASYALDWVTLAVPAAAAVLSPVDQRLNLFAAGPVVVKLDSREGQIDLERLHREYLARARAFDPFAPSRWNGSAATIVSTQEVGGAHALARSSYGEFLDAHGASSQTSVLFRDGGRIIGALILLRRRGEPNITPEETRLLHRLQPFLELVLARGQRSHAAAETHDLLHARGLTPREVEVARLAANGATNAEIGRALFVSLPTVKTHMNHVLTKLGVRSRTELVSLLRTDEQAPP
jgi:DNA-binding CsgD family transcriptional regulator